MEVYAQLSIRSRAGSQMIHCSVICRVVEKRAVRVTLAMPAQPHADRMTGEVLPTFCHFGRS